MAPQTELKNLISQALQTLRLDGVIHLEHPDDLAHGDYSTNIAMTLAKQAGKNPKVLAEEIKRAIPKHEYVDRIEIAGPGFINFFLSESFFRESIQKIDGTFGKSDVYEGKKILVEHSSPNLFKPFHIGHMMNNAIGESIVRLAEYSGGDVKRMAYPSDISLGIAKAVWALQKRGGLEYLDANMGNLDGAIMKIFGDAYAEGNQAFESSEQEASEIRAVYKKIAEDDSSPEHALYVKGKDLNLSYFEHVTHELGSRFDALIFESEAGKVGKEIVQKNVGTVFAESDGAIIYEGEKDGLHTRVFINKEGYPTYEAKDIGLLSLKFDRFHPDISLFVTDYQQAEYFRVVINAANRINSMWKERTIHRTHGRMSFKGAKLSSRLGGVPLATDIISVVVEEALLRMKEKDDDLAHNVALAAIKFAILKAEAGKNINFDPETSLSFEGDSGPYLQYTVARSRSLLEKAEREGFQKSLSPNTSWETTGLEKILYRFPEVVTLSIEEWAPHHVATYLLILARAFNSWYGSTKILDKENPHAGFQIALVEKTAQVLRNGLYLLGIPAPEKM